MYEKFHLKQYFYNLLCLIKYTPEGAETKMAKEKSQCATASVPGGSFGPCTFGLYIWPQYTVLCKLSQLNFLCNCGKYL